ncbi:hypothetical protein Tsubulata_044440 [Turnera subulata]|uniref:TLC domain-containing protein n=1 Tax=Turnera subulata TaxID=218843 RepID=A0A9Q0FZY8_9ROSI|nr:hypothetical protein Tsubulata_044440 [Turnera subulata]
MGLLETNGLMKINWEAESYPAARDFAALAIFALFFPALRLFLDTYFFERIARRMIFGKGYTKEATGTHEERNKIRKFKESAWKCVYFLSAEFLALYVTYDEPWFTDTKYFWVGPGDQIWPDHKLKVKLKGLYMFAAGFYTYSIFALVFWETRRKDFVLSMVHHVATVILIVMSYMLRFARVGSIVLALHDASDVFMEIAKMSKYSGYEWNSSVFFVLFVISWTILRIIYFPFWILRSTSYEILLSLKWEEDMTTVTIYYYVFNTLLFCLLVLHIYWWYLMLKMVVRQIKARGKVEDDVRSDSEGEDEHDD